MFSEILKYTVMKKFKIVDFWISVILIVFFIIFGFATRKVSFIAGYFVVGGWQIASMIVHFVNNWFAGKGELRFYYHRVFLILLIFFTVFFVIAKFFESAYILLWVPVVILVFLFPLMAVYYAYMCYEETFIKMKRPMELLK
jgi:hypothetical protein